MCVCVKREQTQVDFSQPKQNGCCMIAVVEGSVMLGKPAWVIETDDGESG